MHEHDDDRIFQRACTGLAARGNKVYFVVTHEGNAVTDGVEVIGIKRRSGIKRRILSSLEAWRKAKKLKADIIHFHDPDLIPWMLLSAFTGKKIVYDVHENYASRIYREGSALRKTAAGIYRRLENFTANRFAGIVVVTESMRALFRGIKKPVLVVDNLIYLERLKNINISSIEKSLPPVIYTSGTNSPARNCMQAVESLPIILKKVPEVVMRFAGRYYPSGYKEALQAKAGKLGVAGRVIFDDMVPWAENFKRTASAFIGCVFYEDNINNKVTLPNRIYEYMYCGAAVLGEDFPEVRRVINDTGCGIVVNSSDPSAIAAAAVKMLQDPEAAAEMGRRGREAVLTSYNFDSVLPELQNFYKQILSSNG
jgi:glycosyltransferase involved in cell wall biosynthesis